MSFPIVCHDCHHEAEIEDLTILAGCSECGSDDIDLDDREYLTVSGSSKTSEFDLFPAKGLEDDSKSPEYRMGWNAVMQWGETNGSPPVNSFSNPEEQSKLWLQGRDDALKAKGSKTAVDFKNDDTTVQVMAETLGETGYGTTHPGDDAATVVARVEEKLKEITAGILETNPSIDPSIALKIASQTVKRYPKVAGLS